MIRGLSKVETQEFRSTWDDADEDAAKTVWILGALDVNVRAYLQDNSQQWIQQPDGNMLLVQKPAQRNFEVVRFGLRGFRNFKDEKGSDIKIEFVKRQLPNVAQSYDVLSEDVLNQIPDLVVGELAAELIRVNNGDSNLRKK